MIFNNKTTVVIYCGLRIISLYKTVIGGDKDPVSAPNGLKQLHKAWLDSGHQESQLKLYTDSRHELSNETNKQEVFDDLMAWLQQCV